MLMIQGLSSRRALMLLFVNLFLLSGSSLANEKKDAEPIQDESALIATLLRDNWYLESKHFLSDSRELLATVQEATYSDKKPPSKESIEALSKLKHLKSLSIGWCYPDYLEQVSKITSLEVLKIQYYPMRFFKSGRDNAKYPMRRRTRYFSDFEKCRVPITEQVDEKLARRNVSIQGFNALHLNPVSALVNLRVLEIHGDNFGNIKELDKDFFTKLTSLRKLFLGRYHFSKKTIHRLFGMKGVEILTRFSLPVYDSASEKYAFTQEEWDELARQNPGCTISTLLYNAKEWDAFFSYKHREYDVDILVYRADLPENLDLDKIDNIENLRKVSFSCGCKIPFQLIEKLLRKESVHEIEIRSSTITGKPKNLEITPEILQKKMEIRYSYNRPVTPNREKTDN